MATNRLTKGSYIDKSFFFITSPLSNNHIRYVVLGMKKRKKHRFECVK